MKRFFLMLIVISFYITVQSQNCTIGVETGYGISSSRIKGGWHNASLIPLADNCGRAGLTLRASFNNKIGFSTGINYILIQIPDKFRNTTNNQTHDSYFTNVHHLLNMPLLANFTIDYFRLETGMYSSFLIAENAEVPFKKIDVGILVKLNFIIYKGLYFYQETSVGLINNVISEHIDKKNYYLALGLGYSFSFLSYE